MATLRAIADGVWEGRDELRLPLGVRMPARMTVLEEERGLVIVSPIEVDDDLARAIDDLGPVSTIVAPNLLHHLFLPAAVKRWPDARVLGPGGLAKKQPGVRFDGAPTNLALPGIDVVAIDGAPSFEEYVLVHRKSRTAVATDLIFNIERARGMTWLVLNLVSGAYGSPKLSRVWRFATRDRRAFRASIERLLAHDFDRLVVAHGEVVEENARAIVARAAGRRRD